jgi:Mpv17 / PMP22 family
LAVSSRVGLSYLAAIPQNAAFFVYGSLVHHCTKWLALVQEWQYELKEEMGVADPSLGEIIEQVPFDINMAWSTARLKVETELLTTMMAGAAVWIPFHFVNFSLVPPHLRPLTLVVCSAFWNCYLSLVQHRDAHLE